MERDVLSIFHLFRMGNDVSDGDIKKELLGKMGKI